VSYILRHLRAVQVRADLAAALSPPSPRPSPQPSLPLSPPPRCVATPTSGPRKPRTSPHRPAPHPRNAGC
jgi:hypothetical protein